MEEKKHMLTVQQAANLSHVSVRTLHYYHQLGLLVPAVQTENGYRLYDEKTMKRLQHILLFRKLKFPLKEIGRVLDDPCFHEEEALKKQIALLEMEKQQTQQLIDLAKALMKGEETMNFDAFDESKMNLLKQEARKTWGHTDAWKAFEQKKPENVQAAGQEMMEMFRPFGQMLHLSPADDAVQMQVNKLQQFISHHFYPCTNEILAGLGRMYVQDERFRQNIDSHAGTGTARFVSQAIAVYTGK